ncbi:MAG: flagellar biosynthesis protein FlhF, partial [Planctomycetota bacterium]
CPVLPIADVRLLARPWKNGHAPDVVLVDSSGRPGEDASDLMRLDAALKKMDPELALESYVVVPAVSRTSTLEETLDSLEGLPLAGAIVTKVDETANPVPVLEYLLRHGIPLAFVSDGRGLDGALHRANGALFADLLLQGKVR